MKKFIITMCVLVVTGICPLVCVLWPGVLYRILIPDAPVTTFMKTDEDTSIWNGTAAYVPFEIQGRRHGAWVSPASGPRTLPSTRRPICGGSVTSRSWGPIPSGCTPSSTMIFTTPFMNTTQPGRLPEKSRCGCCTGLGGRLLLQLP